MNYKKKNEDAMVDYVLIPLILKGVPPPAVGCLRNHQNINFLHSHKKNLILEASNFIWVFLLSFHWNSIDWRVRQSSHILFPYIFIPITRVSLSIYKWDPRSTSKRSVKQTLLALYNIAVMVWFTMSGYKIFSFTFAVWDVIWNSIAVLYKHLKFCISNECIRIFYEL